MAELLKYTPVQASWRGMDTDTAPHLIAPDRAVAIDNLVPGVPGQLPVRRGFVELGLLRTNTGTVYVNMTTSIIPMRRLGAFALVGSLGHQTTATSWPTAYVSFYQTDGNTAMYPSGKTPDNATPEIRQFDADTLAVNVITQSVAGSIAESGPETQYDVYEGSVYWNSALNAGSTATRKLLRWTGVDLTKADHGNTGSITVGSKTLTLGTAPTGLNLTGMLMFFTLPGDSAPLRYSYEVAAHTTGSTTVTLMEPYGLGGSPGNKTGANVVFQRIAVVREASENTVCCINHLDRLFVGRPTLATAVGSLQPRRYPNGIKWSTPGNPESWPDTNIIIVGADPNEMVMGFARVGGALAVFKKEATYLLLGDSESTFTVKRISATIGCIDSRSIVYWGDNAIFASRSGVFMLTPNFELIKLTTHAGSFGGITREYSRLVGQPSGTSSGVLVAAFAHVVNDYLMVVIRPDYSVSPTLTASYPDTIFVCHLPTRSWAKWYPGDAAAFPVYIAQHPWINVGTRWRFMGAAASAYVGFPYVFNDDPTAVGQAQLFQDSHRALTGSGAQATTAVPVSWKTRDLQLNAHDTASIKQVHLQHGYVYESASGTQAGPALTVASHADGDIEVVPTATVAARRYVTGAAVQKAYYVNQIIDKAYPSSVNTISFRVYGSTTSLFGGSNRVVDNRLYGVVVTWEPGRQGYTQTEVT